MPKVSLLKTCHLLYGTYKYDVTYTSLYDTLWLKLWKHVDGILLTNWTNRFLIYNFHKNLTESRSSNVFFKLNLNYNKHARPHISDYSVWKYLKQQTFTDMFEPSHTESFPLKMYIGTYIQKRFPPFVGSSSCSCHLQQSLNILLINS